MNHCLSTRGECPCRCGLTRFLLIAASLLLASACSSNDDDDDTDSPDPDSSGSTTTYTISATEAQEIPATGSAGTATGTFTLDTQSGELSGSLTTSDVSTSAAHIHEGFAGTNGGVVIALDVDGTTISVPDNTTLDSAQIDAMNNGGYYVNIHTSAFPGGEIRGQIAPEGISVILTALSGDNEVPPVTSQGSGTAYTTINDGSGDITIHVLTSGITTPQAAHLHNGFTGTNGGVALALEQSTEDAGQFSSSEGATLESAALSELLKGGTYINVHSAENAAGELRGQVLPAGVSVLTATLSGDQEVPAVTTSASGTGFVTLDENNSTLTANITTIDADEANAAHIHEAPAGSNGGVFLGMDPVSGSTSEWLIPETEIASEDISTLKAGGMYFNVHTPTNPGGEIRGQIEP